MTLHELVSAAFEKWEIPFAVEPNSVPLTLKIDGVNLMKACQYLWSDEAFYCDQLSSVTGIDNGKEAGTMEVQYHLYSIPFNYSIALKVVLPRETPVVDSVATVWKSANWLEREVFDMFGIQFNNHPDLRRILMPADWEGHPLRKDYQQQEAYRDIKVAY
jgi:NADH-quinone oxidoreductase subunit C